MTVTNTYDKIQQHDNEQQRFTRVNALLEYMTVFPVPPPLNLIGVCVQLAAGGRARSPSTQSPRPLRPRLIRETGKLKRKGSGLRRLLARSNSREWTQLMECDDEVSEAAERVVQSQSDLLQDYLEEDAEKHAASNDAILSSVNQRVQELQNQLDTQSSRMDSMSRSMDFMSRSISVKLDDLGAKLNECADASTAIQKAPFYAIASTRRGSSMDSTAPRLMRTRSPSDPPLVVPKPVDPLAVASHESSQPVATLIETYEKEGQRRLSQQISSVAHPQPDSEAAKMEM